MTNDNAFAVIGVLAFLASLYIFEQMGIGFVGFVVGIALLAWLHDYMGGR
jgi:hypothetical protein